MTLGGLMPRIRADIRGGSTLPLNLGAFNCAAHPTFGDCWPGLGYDGPHCSFPEIGF